MTSDFNIYQKEIRKKLAKLADYVKDIRTSILREIYLKIDDRLKLFDFYL